jgi:antitoxin ParD1/3/4
VPAALVMVLNAARTHLPARLLAPEFKQWDFITLYVMFSQGYRTEHIMERLSITLTGDMARRIEDAVASGRYASASEVIRDALREWEMVQARREQELLALRKDIAEGLADIEAGRIGDFDPKEIIRKGEELLAAQSSRSA